MLTSSLLGVKRLLSLLLQDDRAALETGLAHLVNSGKFWKYGKHKIPQVLAEPSKQTNKVFLLGCHLPTESFKCTMTLISVTVCLHVLAKSELNKQLLFTVVKITTAGEGGVF